MRLGLYTFAALAFVGLVVGFAYTLAPQNYVLDIAGFHLELPVAIWIGLPLLLLVLMTVLHLFYYGTRNYFARRKWQRDAEGMQDAFYWSLIGEPKSHNYAIPNIRMGASLLSVATLELRGLPEDLSPKLARTVAWIRQIYNGEYVDLTEKKVERFLSKENPLLIQNQLNRLGQDPEFADKILRDKGEYAEECIREALKVALQKDTFFKLKKYLRMTIFNFFQINYIILFIFYVEMITINMYFLRFIMSIVFFLTFVFTHEFFYFIHYTL